VPEVTIIMPAHDASGYLVQAVSSVQKQSYPDWELVIVDDGSSDDTLEIALQLSIQDPRIRVLSSSKRLGAGGARNVALDHAHGRYVAFLDSDDLWQCEKLRKQLHFLKESGGRVTFGDYLRITADGRPINRVRAPASTDYHQMLRSNFIGHLTGIYERRFLADHRFDRGGNEDHYFWLVALQRLGQPALSTPSVEPLASYRVRFNSLSGNKFLSARWQWETYRRRLGYGRLQSAIFMGNYALYGVRKRLPLITNRF
jgi:teichuronic acid biosynthesis glycosyltransferase TuaG